MRRRVVRWVIGAGIPAGMRNDGVSLSGGVVVMHLNHRLQDVKPPASGMGRI